MAMRFLNGIDLGQNELQNGVVHNVAAASLPAGTAGQIAYDTTNNYLVFHNGTAWQAIHSGGGFVTDVSAGSGISVSGTTSVTVSHADTSSVSDLSASARTYITGMTFDTYGHVQSLTTGTETVVNTNTTYSTSIPTGTTALRLTGSDASTDDITFTAGSNVTITRTSASEFTIASSFTNTTYSAGTGLQLAGTTFSLSHLGLESLVDPLANKIVYWDASGGNTDWLTIGTNLSISSGTLNATDTNNYANSLAFNTGTGILTVGRQGLSDLTVDLDGRYLESYVETDTLDSVTGRGATTTNAITVGGLTVNGDLTVSGAHNVTIAETLEIEDSLFVLNSNASGAPTEDAGFVIERGTSTNQMFVWDESADEFVFAATTETGSTTGNAVISSYSPIHAGNATLNALTLGSVSNAGTDTDKFLVLDASGNVDFRTGAELLSDIGGQASGSYVTSINTAGNTGTGSLVDGDTLTINGSGLVSVALSGDTFTVSTTANNYVHPAYSTITQNNSGFTFIQDISVDAIGSVTSVATGTVGAATESATGVVELATTSEAATGTDSSRAVTAAGVTAAIKAREHVATIGDGTSTSIAVTHNLATRDVIVQLYDVSTFDTVYADVTRNTVNQITIDFGSAPASGDIRVLIKAVEI